MDRRIEKTKLSIYKGMASLLSQKSYADLSIEDILKASNISRSTFYAHFKSKQEVLSSIAHDIFGHVLGHSLKEEDTHDFSRSSILDDTHIITHILYHLHDDRAIIAPIFSSDAKDVFVSSLRQQIDPLSERFIQQGKIKAMSMRDPLKKEFLTETLIMLMVHWFKHDCASSPETISSYFFEFIC